MTDFEQIIYEDVQRLNEKIKSNWKDRVALIPKNLLGKEISENYIFTDVFIENNKLKLSIRYDNFQDVTLNHIWISDGEGKKEKIIINRLFSSLKSLDVLDDNRIKMEALVSLEKIRDLDFNFSSDNVRHQFKVYHSPKFENRCSIVSATSFKKYENSSISFEKSCLIVRSNDQFEHSFENINIKLDAHSFVAFQNFKKKLRLSNFQVNGGGSGWFEGMYFSGALSLYHLQDLVLKDLRVISPTAIDGINIKHSNVVINGLHVFDSIDDCVDIDKSSVSIQNANIEKCGGDGLDFSMSKGEISNLLISTTKDKSISVGEKSQIDIKKATLKKSSLGIAVKDSSVARIQNVTYENIDKKVDVYQKKNHWDIGKVIYE